MLRICKCYGLSAQYVCFFLHLLTKCVLGFLLKLVAGYAFSSGISSSWIVIYIPRARYARWYIYIYMCVCVCARAHYLILNLYVGRIRKKAIEWHFIIYLNKSDMKINLIRCKNSDENLGKQRKAPSSQLK